MSLKRAAFRGCNAVLRKFNLELQVTSHDFDARLDQPAQVRRIFTDFGRIADRWLAEQKLFSVARGFSSVMALSKFYDQYITSPFRAKQGGSRFNNLAWLYLIADAMKPGFVIDSGTFQGASAWAFSCAGVEVYSFDIDLSRVVLEAPAVIYSQCDWTGFDWRGRSFSNVLIYFDDHLDQVRRLLEASRAGIPLAIFDDDFGMTSFAPMANRGYSLPKIEFALDDELVAYSEVTWVDRGRHYSFPLDHSYLAQARSLIADTDRLPDTSLITGIQQTPYRLVRIADHSRQGRPVST